jgi:hypothetical protein
MSAIQRAHQHAEMVKTIGELLKTVEDLKQRLEALEQKRGPGRPKNEDRKQPSE